MTTTEGLLLPVELNLNDEHKQDLGDCEVRTNVMVPSKKILIC